MAPTDRILLEMLADGSFHSGTVLSSRLGISRAAVWKHIQRLEGLGLEVQAVPGRGYRLPRPLDLLNLEALLAKIEIPVRSLLKSLTLESIVDSTNRRLLEGAKAFPSGSVIAAEYQTEGRGRLGNRWVAPWGEAVCLSVLWRFEESRELSGLSLAIAVALIRAFKKLDIPDVCLKWPNDLFSRGRKLGGILIEIAGEAHGACMVVLGVGINYRLPQGVEAGIDQPATDLERVLGGKLPRRNTLIAGLINEILPVLDHYPALGFKSFLPEWRAAHGFSGQSAIIRFGDREILGTIEDIDSEGFLLFKEQDGTVRSYASGEIRLRLPS